MKFCRVELKPIEIPPPTYSIIDLTREDLGLLATLVHRGWVSGQTPYTREYTAFRERFFRCLAVTDAGIILREPGK